MLTQDLGNESSLWGKARLNTVSSSFCAKKANSKGVSSRTGGPSGCGMAVAKYVHEFFTPLETRCLIFFAAIVRISSL